MTLTRPAARLPRRVSTDADLAAATEVAEGMHAELRELLDRRRILETKYPGLLDPGESDEDLPDGVGTAYDKLAYRIATLQRELLQWAGTAAQVVVKQIEARQKTGELVTVGSAAIYLNEMAQLIRKYADPKFKALAERDARAALQRFMQANPAALLEAGAQAREQELEDA